MEAGRPRGVWQASRVVSVPAGAVRNATSGEGEGTADRAEFSEDSYVRHSRWPGAFFRLFYAFAPRKLQCRLRIRGPHPLIGGRSDLCTRVAAIDEQSGPPFTTSAPADCRTDESRSPSISGDTRIGGVKQRDVRRFGSTVTDEGTADDRPALREPAGKLLRRIVIRTAERGTMRIGRMDGVPGLTVPR